MDLSKEDERNTVQQLVETTSQEGADQKQAEEIPVQMAEKVLEEGDDEGSSVGAKTSATKGEKCLPTQVTAWAKLIRKDQGQNTEIDLIQYKPEYVDGIAKCPLDILAKGEEEWNDYLVGFFIGRRLPYPMVKEALSKQWKLKGSYEVATDEDYFYFKFVNEEDKRQVIEQGPIFIAGRIFVVKPWSNVVDSQRKQIKSIPLWVIIHGIPKKLWTKEGLSYVGSLIGKPICSDEATAKKTRLSFAKICVEVESINDLPTSKSVDVGDVQPVVLNFEYPWKPQQCIKCMEFGHTVKRCGLEKEFGRPRKQIWKPKNDKEKNKDGWQVVERKKHAGGSSVGPINDKPNEVAVNLAPKQPVSLCSDKEPNKDDSECSYNTDKSIKVVPETQLIPTVEVVPVRLQARFQVLVEDEQNSEGEGDFLEDSSEDEQQISDTAQSARAAQLSVQTRAQKSKVVEEKQKSPVTAQKTNNAKKRGANVFPKKKPGERNNQGSGTQPSKSY
ncbi:hypothetical protein FRX31_016361 [Thalictrum thalictroides]|uniref:DUF4283 domain-containing protein n=1 Tax=Thalictrum thalictroides TaxID=46969 RepID=A0A7J6W9D1_THATH|nr:hypothetical protein FRX31_016361 [Thalictrum thalictroides]